MRARLSAAKVKFPVEVRFVSLAVVLVWFRL
jgi:hypothetical protein